MLHCLRADEFFEVVFDDASDFEFDKGFLVVGEVFVLDFGKELLTSTFCDQESFSRPAAL